VWYQPGYVAGTEAPFSFLAHQEATDLALAVFTTNYKFTRVSFPNSGGTDIDVVNLLLSGDPSITGVASFPSVTDTADLYPSMFFVQLISALTVPASTMFTFPYTDADSPSYMQLFSGIYATEGMMFSFSGTFTMVVPYVWKIQGPTKVWIDPFDVRDVSPHPAHIFF
jgi:hypothetical protein